MRSVTLGSNMASSSPIHLLVFFFINFQSCNDGFRIVDQYFNFDFDFCCLEIKQFFLFFA